MMGLTLTTPALLFSAISLLMLAYTNRFLTMAQLVRNLAEKYHVKPEERIVRQIDNLRKRIELIRQMQVFGITSLLLCVLSMFLVYVDKNMAAELVFGVALILLIISMVLCIWEIEISVRALNVHLSSIEMKGGTKQKTD
ncbi:DUF2721 domain-containing protein [Bacteroidales bacterium]|nr:DUF2721 domain-containing protein [Bacteroidales bacterium]